MFWQEEAQVVWWGTARLSSKLIPKNIPPSISARTCRPRWSLFPDQIPHSQTAKTLLAFQYWFLRGFRPLIEALIWKNLASLSWTFLRVARSCQGTSSSFPWLSAPSCSSSSPPRVSPWSFPIPLILSFSLWMQSILIMPSLILNSPCEASYKCCIKLNNDVSLSPQNDPLPGSLRARSPPDHLLVSR